MFFCRFCIIFTNNYYYIPCVLSVSQKFQNSIFICMSLTSHKVGVVVCVCFFFCCCFYIIFTNYISFVGFSKISNPIVSFPKEIEREREREMTTKGHHKKSLSTPVPASESEFIEPSSVPKTDLYVSFGSTGKISVRLDSNVSFVN